jgi:hypothetical protein
MNRAIFGLDSAVAFAVELIEGHRPCGGVALTLDGNRHQAWQEALAGVGLQHLG